MKIFLLEDELSQQIRVEKHIAEIAKELEIKLEVISTGKISEFVPMFQKSTHSWQGLFLSLLRLSIFIIDVLKAIVFTFSPITVS